ncbi:MAG: hypothetical protein K2L11_03720 [Muribaculaceae bacterium]|nr:hypothetical protein [Muribaculaceae bacterium]
MKTVYDRLDWDCYISLDGSKVDMELFPGGYATDGIITGIESGDIKFYIDRKRIN